MDPDEVLKRECPDQYGAWVQRQRQKDWEYEDWDA